MATSAYQALTPLRILSLGKSFASAESYPLRAEDGGGIRGISSLLILENIMEGVRKERGLENVPRPCDVFDFIGGTSTGGLVLLSPFYTFPSS